MITWVINTKSIANFFLCFFAPNTERSGSRAGQTGGPRGGYSHQDAGTAEDGVQPGHVLSLYNHCAFAL